jgi:hypothetical protein
MSRSFLSTLILSSIFSLLVYTVLLSPAAEPTRASQDPIVVNKTKGCEMEASIVGGEVFISLKNNHNDTITAFSIGLGKNHSVTTDFAYSDVRLGLAPNEVYQDRYRLPSSLTGSVPTLYLLTTVLENGGVDGDPVIARRIKEDRLGEKVQVYKALRILEKEEDKKPRDLKTLKSDVAAALNTSDAETLTTLNELQSIDPASSDNRLSEGVRGGLQTGREVVLRRLEELENLPSDWVDEGFDRLKTRFRKLLKRL